MELSGLSGLLIKKHQFDNLCYEFILRSQKILVDQNKKLMMLNSKARALILKKKALETLILTGPPSVRAFALLKRKNVIVKQKFLRMKQKALFYRGSILSRSELFQLRIKMNKHFKKILRLWSKSYYGTLGFEIQWKASQLEVAVNDIAPIYKRGQNHSKNQTHEVVWSAPLKFILPNWISPFIPVGKNWKGRCESHPRKGGLNWYAAIGRDKHSLKPLSSVFF